MGSEIPMQLQKKKKREGEKEREKNERWGRGRERMNVCIHLQGKDQEIYVWNKMLVSNVSSGKKPTPDKNTFQHFWNKIQHWMKFVH